MDEANTWATEALRTFWRRTLTQLAVQREKEAKELRAVLAAVK